MCIRDSAKADELLWRSLQAGRPKALDSYEAAKHRAMSRGFIYIPAEDLAVEATLDEILERLKKLDVKNPMATADADAMLGLVKPTAISITQAFVVYCDKICAADLKGKSKTQLSNWTKVKRRAVNNFVAVCGDLPMDAITRNHAKQIFDWWSGRVNPTDGSKPCLLYTSPSPRDRTRSRMPSSA